MPGLKTNERDGTKAVLRHARVSAYKVREVLDLVRGKPVHEAEDILRFSERDAAIVVGKVVHSAVANAENNDELDPEDLYISACFADEASTMKRWRPRARGRATRIRKRGSHVTVIVSRMPEEQLQRLQARRRAEQLAQRARRVAGARRAEGDQRSRAERRHPSPVEPEDTDALEGADREAAEAEAPETEVAAEGENAEIAEGEAAAVAETEEGESSETAEAKAEAPEAEAAEASEPDESAEASAPEEVAAKGEEPTTPEQDDKDEK